MDFRETSSAEEAIRAAQLIVPVTTTTTGYIQFDWLQAGAILVNISLDDPLPEVVLRATKSSWTIGTWSRTTRDAWWGGCTERGRLLGPTTFSLPPGHLWPGGHPSARRIDAQLGEVVVGSKPGRGQLDDDDSRESLRAGYRRRGSRQPTCTKAALDSSRTVAGR